MSKKFATKLATCHINVLYFRKAGALRISNMILRGRWTQVDKSGCRWMHVNESGWKYLRCYKHIWCSYLDLVRSRWWILPCQPSSCFLAVQNSSIGDLVMTSLTQSLSQDFTTWHSKSDPRDLWPLSSPGR